MATRRKQPKPTSTARLPTVMVKHDSGAGHSAITELAERLPGTASVPERVSKVVQQTSFHGPIPHPDIFKKYGDVLPDAPERILRVFEQDSAHARDIQMAALEAQRSDNRRVHWMAWTLIAGGYVLALVFGYLDKDWLAGTILATTLAGTITGFLQSRKSTSNDEGEN